jgi:hypothetical protein
MKSGRRHNVIASKQQIVQTLDLMCVRHQKVLDNFTSNKFVPVTPEEIIDVCHAMNALELYTNLKKRYQSA